MPNEYEEVKIQVPSAIMNFLRSINVNPSEYFSESLPIQFEMDLDAFQSDPKVFLDLDKMVEKCGLKNIQ